VGSTVSLIGMRVYVSEPIGGSVKSGKVMVAGFELTAFSTRKIKRGQMVEVMEMPAYRTVVVKWSRWLNL
jgi:membrane-bound ClpP family serine protease